MSRRRSGGYREPLSAVSVTATDDFQANGTSSTRTGLSIGAEPSSPQRRYVVVFPNGVTGFGSNTITGVTMFGETGIELASVNGDATANYASMWYAEVPTGISGSVTLTYSASLVARMGLTIATFTSGFFGVTEITATDTSGTETAGLIQLSATAKKGGLVLANTCARNGSTTTFTGPTEIFDRDAHTTDYTAGAYKQVTADGTENVDFQNADTTPDDMAAVMATIY